MLSSLSAARQGQSAVGSPPVQTDGVKKREVRLMKNRCVLCFTCTLYIELCTDKGLLHNFCLVQEYWQLTFMYSTT